MRNTITLILTILFFSQSLAQDKTIRLPIEPTSFGYDVYPLDSTGVMLLQRVGQVKSRMLTKKVKFFDKDLVQKNEFEISIDERYVVRDWVWDSRGVFFLYQKRMLQNQLGVMHVKPSGDNEFYNIPLVETMDIKHFHVFGNTAVIGGIFEWKPTFFLYEMETNRIIALQGVYQRNTNLIQSLVDKKYNVVSVLTSQGQLIGRVDYKLANYSFDGVLERSVDLKPKKGVDLVSAVMTNFKDGYQYVIGSYTQGMNKGYTGVYVAKIGPDGSQEYTYTPYFQLQGMYAHLGSERAERIVTKAKKQFDKKEKWITSRRMQFFLPHLSKERIYVSGFSTISSENNLYQFSMDFDGNPEILLNAPFQKRGNIIQLNTKFQNGFWTGKSWTYDEKFYFTNIFRGGLSQYVVGAQSPEVYNFPLVDFQPFKLFQDIERYMHYWYDNRIVTARMESDGMNGAKSTRVFIVTSWSVGSN